MQGEHGMRGGDDQSGALFSYVDMESRVPQSHPLRVIRALTNEALASLAAGRVAGTAVLRADPASARLPA